MRREVKLQAVQMMFSQMTDRGWFSACGAKEAARLLDVSFATEHKRFLDVLHCVRFADMTEDVKSELQSILEETFSQEAFTIVVGRSLLGRPKTKQLRIGAG